MSTTALVPMSMTEMNHLAKAISESKMFGMQNQQQALVLMALCQSEGKDPIQAVRQFHVINGKPAMRADAMLAEFQRQGGKVAWGDRTNASVTGTFSHPSGGEVTVTWTLKDAETAQLLGNPTWKKFPRQMLTARVVSEAIRTILPGVVAGIYTPEEVNDIIEAEIVEQPRRTQAPAQLPQAPRQVAAKAPENVTPPKAQSQDPEKAAAIAEFTNIAGTLGVDVADPNDRRALLVDILWPTEPAPARPATTDEWKAATQLLKDNGLPKLAEAPPAPPAPGDIDPTGLEDPFAGEEG
jgi:hypothetical protein